MSARLRPVPAEHYAIRRAFKVSEAAWLLGCSARAVLDMIHAGRLAAIKPTVNGGYYIIPKLEIERLIDSAERRSA